MRHPSNFDFHGTDRFQIISLLGDGGMGMVYRALDRETGAHVALKVLEAQSPVALMRFKKEFRALQGLEHPNLISLGELSEARGVWFFTMELLDGVDFLTYVTEIAPEAGPRFDEARLRDALVQLARGLRVLHRAGKIHRDIKPPNLLITREHRLVLLDFGLVFDKGDRDSVTGDQIVGTGAYMAPEQATPGGVGPPADWYAVGVLLYEALCGQLPFEGAMLEILVKKQSETPTPPGQLADGVPADLEALCVDLLQIRPDARPTADDVLRRLGHVPDARDDAPALDRAERVFVGRTRELAALRAASAAKRLPRTVLVRGPSGVGKSALVQRFTDEVESRSPPTLVLSGRCYERESVPFKGTDGVIDTLSHYLRGLPVDQLTPLLPGATPLLLQAFPSLRRVEAMRGVGVRVTVGARGPTEIRRRVFDALRELLARIAKTTPLVITIDDMQWAGADTWALLGHLMGASAPRVLLVLMTRAPEDEDQRSASLPGAVETIAVEALAPTEAVALARALLTAVGATPPGDTPAETAAETRDADASPDAGDAAADAADAALSELAATIAHEADGHPLFIRELVNHVAEGGGGAIHQTRLEDALIARFSRLPEPARRVLQLIAAAGLPIAHATIADAAGLEFADYARALTALRGAHLVRTTGARRADRVVHYHDRIRQAALGPLDDAERRLLHRQLANAFEEEGIAEEAPQLAVHHLAAAGQDHRAAYYAEIAGARAMDALAFDQAASLYRIARDLGVHNVDTGRRLALALARALVAAGRGVEAAEIYLETAEHGDETTRLDYHRQGAEQLLFTGHIERGVEILAQVLSRIGESLASSPRRALISFLLRRAWLRLTGLRFRARDVTEIAPRDLVRLEVYKTVSEGLGLIDSIRAAEFQARHLRLALELGEPTRVIRALAIDAVFTASLGVPRTRRIAELVAELAKADGGPTTRAYALFAAASVQYFLDNDWAAARATLEASESLLQNNLQAAGWETDSVRMFQCLSLLHVGDLATLATRVRSYLAEADSRGDRYAAVNLRARLVLPQLAADDPDAAERAVDDALDAWIPWRERYTLQHFYALHSRCEIALYRGDPAQATQHLDTQRAALGRSALLRVPLIAAEYEYVTGRVALAIAAGAGDRTSRRAGLARARRSARRLARSRVPVAAVMARLLRAGIKRVAARTPDAGLDALRAVVADGGREDRAETDNGADGVGARHGLLIETARYWLGARGDAEQRDRAARWLKAAGVAEPRRLCAVLLPGWDDS